jgi:hypothetical protein
MSTRSEVIQLAFETNKQPNKQKQLREIIENKPWVVCLSALAKQIDEKGNIIISLEGYLQAKL